MGKRLRKLKKIRLHREGADTLVLGFLVVALFNALVFSVTYPTHSSVTIVTVGITSALYLVLVNFFRCPIRRFEAEDSPNVVVAPADGKIVVVEEVEENEYFHDRRMMVSIFMSLFNVHANWVPVEGTVKMARHNDGRFQAAWLPKASIENERSTVVITTPDGQDVLVRQVAGAMARRIVTYLQEGDQCCIDEHMGFIKFGSRVDVYLPLNSEVLVEMGQATVGNQTVLARLNPEAANA